MLTFLEPRSRNQDQDTMIHEGLEQEDLSHTTVFLYSLYRALNFREDDDRKGRMSKLPSPSHGIDDSSAEGAYDDTLTQIHAHVNLYRIPLKENYLH